MLNITDLPLEILELIFEHLIGVGDTWDHLWHRQSFQECKASSLRLVCRAWADWLYEHHLHRMLTFKSASRSLAFIEYRLGTRSTTRLRARCQHLEVYPLWTCEDPHLEDEKDMINSEVLERLLDHFSDTVTTLDLYFLHPFSMRPQTIQAIGRMKGLKTLGLHGSELVAGTAHPACFERLIAEAQSLKSLRLALPVSLPADIHPIPDLNMPAATSRYPSITHLELELDDLSPEMILDLSLAFKPSLKVLTLEDNTLGEEMQEMDAQLLRPIYETLRESIEGLSTNNISYLTSTHNLTFPKLQMLAVYDDLNSVIDVLGQDKQFAQSPIEILAVEYTSETKYTDQFTPDSLSNWRQLKKLVFLNWTPQDDHLPKSILDVCKARKIHWICTELHHTDVSQIMNL